MLRSLCSFGLPALARLRARVSVWSAAIALPLFLAAGGVAAAKPGDSLETSAIKAAFVYNFAKFTSWPPGRFRGSSDPVRFCVQQGDLHPGVQPSLEGKQIGTRPVRFVFIEAGTPLDNCHLLFASGFRSEQALASVMEVAQRNYVLVISDMPGFAASGGHIELVEDRGRLRFQVNLSVVAMAELKLGSQLLQLAEIVGPTRK